MTHRYDTIIIGAGHNGLVAAAYLRQQGKKVLVLERRDIIAGSLVTESFAKASPSMLGKQVKFPALTFSGILNWKVPWVEKEPPFFLYNRIQSLNPGPNPPKGRKR